MQRIVLCHSVLVFADHDIVPTDGAAMKRFRADPAMANSLSAPVKIYLALCIDGMNPFGSGTFSVTPMLLMFLNLPAHMSGMAQSFKLLQASAIAVVG